MAKVLIVDDERSIRTTLGEFVKEDGHAVFVAENADEALRIVAAEAPDIVVTDIILPKVDGIALLRRIHGEHPDIQVIVITGEPTVDTASEAVRQGALDYLSKPISGAAIRATVASAVRIKRMADDRRRLEEENLRYRDHLEEEIARTAGELWASEARYRAVVEHATEAIFIAQDGVLPFVNPAAVEISGYSSDELRSVPFAQLLHPDDRDFMLDRYVRQLDRQQVPETVEVRIIRADGDMRWLEIRSVLINWGDHSASLNFANDITGRKLTSMEEEERRIRIQHNNEALLELAMNSASYQGEIGPALRAITEATARTIEVARAGVWLFDRKDASIRCVDRFDRDEGTHLAGKSVDLAGFAAYSAAIAAERILVVRDACSDPRTAEWRAEYLDPNGIRSLMDSQVVVGGALVGVVRCEHVGPVRTWTQEGADFMGSVAGLASLALESAHRRDTERALERSEAEYRGLFENSPASVFVEDFSGIRCALDGLRAQGVVDLDAYLDGHPEVVDACMRSIRIVDANETAIRLHRATSKADLLDRIMDSFPVSAAGMLRDRLLAIWRGERVFEATAEDRTLDGGIIHTALRWSVPPGREATLDRVLLAKTDITSVVEAEQRLLATLDGTIEAIGRATESRDPYTAGHQRLVTDLAVAIARELELDDGVVAGIRAAGLLHDVGKLSIPAEILSKPSALSKMEMEMMKGHPQSGYDILKTVDFPWPIAEIVLQHHERLDGEGYPQGLRGEAIRLEARVLAVADVVEAMASHRPYRPALGIDVALAEIADGRGKVYDAAVVDACLRLFRDGRFVFRAGAK